AISRRAAHRLEFGGPGLVAMARARQGRGGALQPAESLAGEARGEMENTCRRRVCVAHYGRRAHPAVCAAGRRRGRDEHRPGDGEDSMAAELSGAVRAGAIGGAARKGSQIHTALYGREIVYVRHLGDSVVLRRRYRKGRMEKGVLEGFQSDVAAIRDVDVAGGERRDDYRGDRYQ